ncbi:FAD-dependent oxidoreductase [Haloarculaceae archaeon H-GB2-1]|nr:FAD-dependent oxidoreductase [Haloarculaceae archaeon H-GB1-1]MEA5389492.1 FAD-dependent oxidoreductase [Haloarculaceae archaeon H-GB11]MEA5410054.1 FAD-dependent oxidoreductase [Haloarculaceae archaeon H-GB2-1]
MTTDHSDFDATAGVHESLWIDTSDRTTYDSLDGDRRVDVAVVGGGIAGVSTAFELEEAGQTVALLERDRILDGTTGRTTAKVTSLHGLVYDHLLNHFGVEKAKQYADANQWAIDAIEDRVEAFDVDCGFERAPATTYVEPGEDRQPVRREAEAARRLGLPVRYEEDTELPYDVHAAVTFDEQAHFHPRRYLLALTEELAAGASDVYENTTVQNVDGGTPCRVETDHGTVTADAVVVASHFPVVDDAFYFARLSPKRSYVLAASLDDPTPDGMYYDPTEPYFSIRPHAGDDSLVLFGGQNHRTGHGGSTRERYRALERQVRNRFAVDDVEYRWSTQDYVSVDHVPFVGSLAPQDPNVYVATGFGGWGMTNATAAGKVLADEIRDRENPWSKVYRPTRFNLGASKSDLYSHNKHAMTHMVEDYVEQRPELDLSAVQPGDGRVFEGETGEDPVAVYRDDDGEVHAVSAACTHMGCLVTWNDGDTSWDCPCHGSRFDVDGSVLDTPAIGDLAELDVGRRPRIETPESPGEQQ